MALLAVHYTRRSTFSGVGFHDSVEEALAAALAGGYTLATVGPRTRGAPKFYARDGSAWREVESDEFERLRGVDESGTLPRSRYRESEPPLWSWAA